jgi:hypothetical protein
MMTKTILGIITLCWTMTVTAQTQYQLPIVCDRTEAVISALENNYKETLSWRGQHGTDGSVLSLWINDRTGAWTLLKMTPEVSCIIGAGAGSKLILGYPV